MASVTRHIAIEGEPHAPVDLFDTYSDIGLAMAIFRTIEIEC